MRNLLFALVLLVIGISSCSSEKNTIIGNISGLEKGDIVYLASGNIIQTPKLVKSVTVRTDGEFELKTTISDTYVRISIGKQGEEFKPKARNTCGFFLEGFSTLSLAGEADQLNYLQVNGGLYSMAKMAELNVIRQEALTLQKEGLDIFNYVRDLKKANKTPKDGENKEHADKSLEELEKEGMDLLNKSNSIFGSQDSLSTAFLLNNPDMAYSAELLFFDYDTRANTDLFEKTFLNLSPRVQNTNAGELIAQQINAIKSTNIGSIAPDFTALDMNGNSITLSGFKGKYVLLEFWATWCGPCRVIAPRLVSLNSKYAGSDFQIIGVATQERSETVLKNTISEKKMNWLHINDTNTPDEKKVQNLYAIMGIPTCFFIGPDGKIIAKGDPNTVIPVIEKTLEK